MQCLVDISEDTEGNPLLDWKPVNLLSYFTNMVRFPPLHDNMGSRILYNLQLIQESFIGSY